MRWVDPVQPTVLCLMYIQCNSILWVRTQLYAIFFLFVFLVHGKVLLYMSYTCNTYTYIQYMQYMQYIHKDANHVIPHPIRRSTVGLTRPECHEDALVFPGCWHSHKACTSHVIEMTNRYPSTGCSIGIVATLATHTTISL